MSADTLPLDELVRLNAARTPGVWRVEPDKWGRPIIHTEGMGWEPVAHDGIYTCDDTEDDCQMYVSQDLAEAAFIAAIANAAPHLIAAAREAEDGREVIRVFDVEIQRLRAELDAAKARADELTKDRDGWERIAGQFRENSHRWMDNFAAEHDAHEKTKDGIRKLADEWEADERTPEQIGWGEAARSGEQCAEEVRALLDHTDDERQGE